MSEFLNAFFGWVGGIAIFAAVICMIDSRIAGLVACAWIAWVDAKREFRREFAASFQERYQQEFPQQSILRTGSDEGRQDPTF